MCHAGSSSSGFANWTKLRLLSLQLNNRLDWDLSLLKHWPTIANMIAFKCQIRGTLLSSWTHERSVLAALLLNENAISGTTPNGFFENATSLKAIQLSNNAISGVLPKSMVSLPLTTALLFNDLLLSGTLPVELVEYQTSPTENRRSEPATVFNTLAGQCVVNGSCVTSPGFPLPYSSLDVCLMNVLVTGYLSASSFATEYGWCPPSP